MCAFLLFSSFVQAAESGVPLRLGVGQSVVFDGDSGTNRRTKTDEWTWPFLQLMEWDKTWADVFSQDVFCWCPELKLKFANFAVGGSRSDEILARIERVLARKPDWVFVTVGTNDAAAGMAVEDFEKNVRAYCKKLTEAGAKVVFISNLYVPPDMGLRYPKNFADHPKRVPYKERLSEIAKSMEGVVVLDITDFLRVRIDELAAQSPEHTVLSDGAHYNNVGATIVAGAVLSAFDLFPRFSGEHKKAEEGGRGR